MFEVWGRLVRFCCRTSNATKHMFRLNIVNEVLLFTATGLKLFISELEGIVDRHRTLHLKRLSQSRLFEQVVPNYALREDTGEFEFDAMPQVLQMTGGFIIDDDHWHQTSKFLTSWLLQNCSADLTRPAMSTSSSLPALPALPPCGTSPLALQDEESSSCNASGDVAVKARPRSPRRNPDHDETSSTKMVRHARTSEITEFFKEHLKVATDYATRERRSFGSGC